MGNYTFQCEYCSLKPDCENPFRRVQCDDIVFNEIYKLKLLEDDLDVMDKRFYGALFGSVVGDSLGVPVEFYSRDRLKESPVDCYYSFKTHNQPMGTWSDDSSMMICLVDAITKSGGFENFDISILSKNFANWYAKSYFTATNSIFDIGGTCLEAICNIISGNDLDDCGKKGEMANGNGALMRILPLAFCTDLNADTYELVERVATLTHNHEISTLGCLIYVIYCHYLFKGYSKVDALSELKNKLDSYYFNKYLRYKPYYDFIWYDIKDLKKLYKSKNFKSSGYVVNTLESALLCFLFEDNYNDCVLSAVNLGGDTDTTACVAGGMAGMYYGLTSINENWLHLLQRKEYLSKMFNEFKDVIMR